MTLQEQMHQALRAAAEWIAEAKYKIDCGDSERRIRLYHVEMKVLAAIAAAEHGE